MFISNKVVLFPPVWRYLLYVSALLLIIIIIIIITFSLFLILVFIIFASLRRPLLPSLHKSYPLFPLYLLHTSLHHRLHFVVWFTWARSAVFLFSLLFLLYYFWI